MPGEGFLGKLYYSITGEDKLRDMLRADIKLAEQVAKIAGGITIGRTHVSQEEARAIVNQQRIAREKEKTNRETEKTNILSARRVLIEQKEQTEIEKTAAATARRMTAEINLQNAQNKREAIQQKLSQTDQTAAGSIKMLEAELKKLKDTYRSLSETDRNSPLGQTMLKEINNADKNLAQINAQMANNAALAKTMGTQYNGLRTQIGMVARELPNLGISISTFILSLSNNLPYLADEISKARKEFDLMKASGQAATPVWKQMVGAIFNWQTALIVGVTVLTAYSREIQAWVEELFSSKKAIDSNVEALDEFQKKVADSSASLIATFESLRHEWNSLSGDIEKQNRFILESQDGFNKLGVSVRSVDEAEILFNGNTDKFIDSLLARAKAAAAMDLAAEKYKKAIEKMMEADNAQVNFWDRLSAISPRTGMVGTVDVLSSTTPKNVMEQRRKKLREDAEDAFKEAGELIIKYSKFTEEEQRILETLGIQFTDKIVEGSVAAIEAAIALRQKALKDLTNPEDYRKAQEDIEKLEQQLKAITGESLINIDYNKLSQDVLNASKALEEAIRRSELNIEKTRISLMEEGGEKQLAQLKLNFRERMEEIKRETEEYVRLVQDEELKAWKVKNPTKEESEFVPTTVDFNTLPENLQNKILEQASLANKEYENNTQNLINDLIKKWGDYGDKRALLEAETADRIKQVNSVRDLIGDDIADKAIEALKKELQESINALESESLKLTPFYQQLFGDIANYGNAMLRSLIDQTKNILSEVQKAGKSSKGTYFVEVDGEQIELTEGDIARLQKRLGEMDRQMSTNNPFIKLKNAIRDYKYASSDAAKDQAFKEQLQSISAIAGVTAQTLSSLRDTLNVVGAGSPELHAALGGLETTLNGLASIDLSRPFSAITGGLQVVSGLFQTIFNPRQARLQKIIEQSRLEVKKLQGAYEDLDRTIQRQLGAVTEQQAKVQIQNLERQRNELVKQRQAEQSKKKSDQSAIQDYNEQIKKLNEEIRYFYEDLAGEQFGINIKDWAGQIADALTNAFASGESAAEAFDKTVASIMKNVFKNILQLQYIEPAMSNLRNFLFGSNGRGGILGDGELSQSDAASLVGELQNLKDVIGKSQEVWEQLNKAAEEAGVSLEDQSNQSSLSESIKGVSEDTANLLGSYINAIRADGSVNRLNLQKIVDNMIPPINTIALRIADLKHLETIARNTGRNADIAGDIRSILDEVTRPGSSRRLNV